MRRYSPLRPKKLRKYHEMEETQRTSISGVSTPRCNIDLKPSVNGNGSLTIANSQSIHALYLQIVGKMGLTENETIEEKVDPAHDDHLGDHHHHLRLHACHHRVHLGGVRKRIGRCGGGVLALLWRAVF